jgi:glutathione peroxidase-family protein
MSAYYEAARPLPFVSSVNVASRCGYTDSNYRQLQVLQEKYGDDGLQVLAMPSNEFGGQHQKERGGNGNHVVL